MKGLCSKKQHIISLLSDMHYGKCLLEPGKNSANHGHMRNPFLTWMKSMGLLMWTQSVKTHWCTILYMLSFVQISKGVHMKGIIWNTIFFFQYTNYISHYLQKNPFMVCHTLTHSLNLLSYIATVDTFHSRHYCNTMVINRQGTYILSSFQVSYWRFSIAMKLY